MDIADLRKKAREGKAKDDQPETSTPSVPESRNHADTGPERFEAPQNLAPEALSADDGEEDALERLFSGRHAQELAAAEDALSVVGEKTVDREQDVSQYLAFHLGREEYALSIAAISEIIKVKEFTDVPRAPDFVLGIISLRGVIVPVFDLMVRLDLGQSRVTANSRIIVCQAGELIVGLLVDSIHQVVKLAEDGIEPPPAVLSGLDRDFMVGVGRHDGRMIILLDVDNILNIEMIRQERESL